MKALKIMTIALALMAVSIANAAGYPERTIRILVNSVAGGGGDILTRLLADALAREFNQSVVVDNRPGAGGNVAGNVVATEKPDGYTLLMGDSGMLVINPALYKSMPFNPEKDLDLAALVAQFPIVITAHPGSGMDSIATLIAKAKAQPDTISYASTGIGSPQHLTAELLQMSAGIKLRHIPYKGGAQALIDLIAGRVPIGFIGIPPIVPRVRNGELLGLSVTTLERSVLLPQVPTVAETIPGFTTAVWFGLLGPKGLPPEVGRTLNAAVAKVMKSDDMKKKLSSQGYELMSGTVPEIKVFMAREAERWAAAVKESGAKVE